MWPQHLSCRGAGKTQEDPDAVLGQELTKEIVTQRGTARMMSHQGTSSSGTTYSQKEALEEELHRRWGQEENQDSC